MTAITPAASVYLSRGPGSREIYAVLRSAQLKFFGGFWAFPGGKLTAAEAHDSDFIGARRAAACRELFEETGILIARRVNGEFPHIDDELKRCREELLNDRLPFDQFLRDHGLTVRASDFAHVGELTTPAFAAVRFATTFFAAHCPSNQETDVRPGELDRGEWIETEALLARWLRGEALLTPPSVASLQMLGDCPVEEAPRLLGPAFTRLAQGAIHPIYFAPAVQMIPLRTMALPPSTHTNAYLVGTGPRYLLDPGCHDADEQERLFGALDEAGGALTAIVLTHHHPDHIGAANACAKRYDIPIWAHPATADKLRGHIEISRLLRDGDRLDLGACPAHGESWFLEAVHTPGHASGHLAFFEPQYRLLFAGDMISTLSSMVIAPPDGHLGDYLQSLRRLRELPTRMLLPSHGNVSVRPAEVIDDALAHRAKREAQLLEALNGGPAEVEELTQRLYRGTPDALMRFARAQVLAGLLKLQEDGRAFALGEQRWQLA